MLVKRKEGSVSRARLQGVAAGLASGVMDRRTFLRRSGLVAGGAARARHHQLWQRARAANLAAS